MGKDPFDRTRGNCSLCHAPILRAELVHHLAERHESKNHVGQVISEAEAESYFHPKLKPERPKNVRITPEEHAVVRRLNDVHEKAHKAEKSGELDDWAFVYGFFVGAGLPLKRAHEFTLLVCYNEWAKDPVFARALS